MPSRRKFTLTLEPVAGGVHFFYAFVNGSRKIAASGGEKRSWAGTIPNGQTHLKVRVSGIGNAIYKAVIDLPGTTNDQSLTFQLNGGYHEFEINL